MVGFDDVGVFFVFAGALDDVRIDGALSQEIYFAQLVGFAFKNAHELFANNFPLALWVCYPFQCFHIFFDRINGNEIHALLAAKSINHL